MQLLVPRLIIVLAPAGARLIVILAPAGARVGASFGICSRAGAELRAQIKLCFVVWLLELSRESSDCAVSASCGF